MHYLETLFLFSEIYLSVILLTKNKVLLLKKNKIKTEIPKKKNLNRKTLD